MSAGRGRDQAYKQFKLALAHPPRPGTTYILLVDAEEPVTADSRWSHVGERSTHKLEQPKGAKEQDLFLMTVTMERWLLADQETLAAFFGQGFNANSLPRTEDLEWVTKDGVNDAMANATKHTKTQDPRRIP